MRLTKRWTRSGTGLIDRAVTAGPPRVGVKAPWLPIAPLYDSPRVIRATILPPNPKLTKEQGCGNRYDGPFVLALANLPTAEAWGWGVLLRAPTDGCTPGGTATLPEGATWGAAGAALAGAFEGVVFAGTYPCGVGIIPSGTA